MIRPCSKTMIQSEFRTVEKRWAMTKVVRPLINLSIPSCTNCSVGCRWRTGPRPESGRADRQRRRERWKELPLALAQIGPVVGQHRLITVRRIFATLVAFFCGFVWVPTVRQTILVAATVHYTHFLLNVNSKNVIIYKGFLSIGGGAV